MEMNLGKLWEMVRDREAWHATVHGVQRSRHDWVTEQQQCLIMAESKKVLKIKILKINVGMSKGQWTYNKQLLMAKFGII